MLSLGAPNTYANEDKLTTLMFPLLQPPPLPPPPFPTHAQVVHLLEE